MTDDRPIVSSRGYKVAEMIRDRKGFKTHGAMSARVLPDGGLGFSEYGKLTGMDQAQFKTDCRFITYVVWSYSTPIAWYSEPSGWYVVKQRFSPTTGKHQGKLYLIPRDEERATPSTDAGLGVGHVWTNTRCPAYTSLKGEDCTCND